MAGSVVRVVAAASRTAEMQPADVSFLDQEDYYDAHEDEDEA